MTVYAADWVLPVDAPPIPNGAVAFEDGKIVGVGPVDDVGEPDRDFADAAIVPGFINAHSHIEYAVYAGFGDGLDFGPWIALHIERKRRLDLDDTRAIARWGAAQCLRSGITTTGDASFNGSAAEACADVGLRAVVYLEAFGAPDLFEDWFEENAQRIEPVLGDLVELGVSPHAPYSVAPESFEFAAGLDLPIATHLAETEAEQQWLRDGTGEWSRFADIIRGPLGTTGIRMLAERGLLSEDVLAIHCVHADDEEIGLLAEHGVAVAHCPRSNAILGCGIAPLRAFLDAGLRVGIGTDGISSTPSHDMFDELRTTIYAARSRARRGNALTATEALELGTLGSARALGLDDDLGTLTPGKRADLAVVSLADSPYLPWEDPAAAVVFGGSAERVILTLVDGVARYEKGVTEWHELIAAASSARGRMLHAQEQPLVRSRAARP